MGTLPFSAGIFGPLRDDFSARLADVQRKRLLVKVVGQSCSRLAKLVECLLRLLVIQLLLFVADMQVLLLRI